MAAIRCLTVVALGAVLAACDGSAHPTRVDEVFRGDPTLDLAAAGASVTGGGHYDVLGLDVQFAVGAVRGPDGGASGRFHITADEGGGLTVDFSGTVTCLTVDPVNRRAWIGGVVTANRSTDPDLLTEIHEPGDDVWFRVRDAGAGQGVVDRTSFYGFKGAAGIQTSAEYCAARIWPDNDARTWPVTSGNISVRAPS